MKNAKLITGPELLAELFSEESRPTIRWLQMMVKRGAVPNYKISGLRRFDADEVRAALRKSTLIRARQ